jgi:hypothetical protein
MLDPNKLHLFRPYVILIHLTLELEVQQCPSAARKHPLHRGASYPSFCFGAGGLRNALPALKNRRFASCTRLQSSVTTRTIMSLPFPNFRSARTFILNPSSLPTRQDAHAKAAHGMHSASFPIHTHTHMWHENFGFVNRSRYTKRRVYIRPAYPPAYLPAYLLLDLSRLQVRATTDASPILGR